VGDKLESIVGTHKKRAGVHFEPSRRRFKGAWFRDPDGNILHINSA
jgi:hypothetical protein